MKKLNSTTRFVIGTVFVLAILVGGIYWLKHSSGSSPANPNQTERESAEVVAEVPDKSQTAVANDSSKSEKSSDKDAATSNGAPDNLATTGVTTTIAETGAGDVVGGVVVAVAIGLAAYAWRQSRRDLSDKLLSKS